MTANVSEPAWRGIAGFPNSVIERYGLIWLRFRSRCDKEAGRFIAAIYHCCFRIPPPVVILVASTTAPAGLFLYQQMPRAFSSRSNCARDSNCTASMPSRRAAST